jgi:NitT/TauT family transport system permease protein
MQTDLDVDPEITKSPDRDVRQPRRGPVSRCVSALRRRPEIISIPLFFVVVVLVWQFGANALGIPPYVLPTPSKIISVLFGQFGSATFWVNVRTTATEAFLGYLLGVFMASALGLLISQVRLAEKTFLPYVVGFQSIPIIALAPVFVIWFGFGLTSKIVMSAILAFFPMLINVIEGLRACGPDELSMLRSFGANRMQVFTKVRLPKALPFIFAGLDVGVVFCVLGAVVGEFVGAKVGLGYQLLQFNFNFEIAGVFAMLVSLALMGILAHLVIKLGRRRVVLWERHEQRRKE